jgi:hypothetical protein
MVSEREEHRKALEARASEAERCRADLLGCERRVASVASAPAASALPPVVPPAPLAPPPPAVAP